MLNQLLKRAAFEVVGLVTLAFAAGVAVVSAAYGLYALLRTSLSAAVSAGLTSMAAIILIAILAVVLIRLIKAKAASKVERPRGINPETVQKAVSVGAVVAGLLADTVLQWRLEHQPDKHRRRGERKRR